MAQLMPLVAYIGPETIVPLASLLAVIGGVLLCGWQWVCAMCQRCCRSMLGKRDDAALASGGAGGSTNDEIRDLQPASSGRAGG